MDFIDFFFQFCSLGLTNFSYFFFSLRYLQLENRILPPIESPIRSNKPKNLTGSFSVNDVASNKLSKTIGLRSSNSLNDLQTKANHELDTAGSGIHKSFEIILYKTKTCQNDKLIYSVFFLSFNKNTQKN